MTAADWDAGERGLTPDEWAYVFEAGADAANAPDARDSLKTALAAMATACHRVERERNSRHG